MSRKIKLFVIFAIVFTVGFFAYTYFFTNKTVDPASDQVGETSLLQERENTEAEPPTFVWSFAEDDSLNLDGMPQTNVLLNATYSDGEAISKLIDTTPGGCNELPEAAEDSVAGSAVVQCYSAGLGYRYKITEGDISYLVWRKTFEEALPDHTPPPYEYEVVAEFPLSL